MKYPDQRQKVVSGCQRLKGKEKAEGLLIYVYVGFLLEMMEMFWNYIEVMVVQHCEY